MLKRFPPYPVLFAVFPILSIAAHNIQEIAARDMARPLAVSLLLGIVIYGTAWLFVRDWPRAALTALVILVLFFSYGQIYAMLKGISVNGVALFRHRTLAPVWGLLILASSFFSLRWVKQPKAFSYWLNLLSAFLLIYPIFTISAALIQKLISEGSAHNQRFLEAETQGNKIQPDIYYIILDAYGREDVLRTHLAYDNHEFLNELRQRGFYVADCSQANYAYTEFSLSSSLNYDYLENLKVSQHSTRVARLKHSTLRSFLEARGYKVVAFPTGWNNTEWEDADIYPTYDKGFTTLSEFEQLVVDTTLLRIPADFIQQSAQTAGRSELHRKRTLSLLATMKQLPSQNEPLLVFAHVIVPHPPYTFGPDGELSEYPAGGSFDDFRKAYNNQVTFINREILKVIDALLSESKTPPVIIVQGDHGPPPELSETPEKKMPILNAYYLPGVDTQKVLYPSISPVNTFRIVLNAYFSQDLPLLEDHSYFAPNENHERLELVPNFCP